MRAFIVYDPVMVASSGDALSGSGFVEAVAHKLLPLVDCLTPNLAEAAALLRRTDRAKRSGHGAPGQGVIKTRPARGSGERRPSGQRRGGRPFGDRGRRSSLSGAKDCLPKLARHRLHPVERHRRQRCSRRSVAGGCSGGEGIRAPGDRAWSGRYAWRGTRPTDPDRVAFETLTHSIRTGVSLELLARRLGGHGRRLL